MARSAKETHIFYVHGSDEIQIRSWYKGLNNAIRKLQQELGFAMIFVTHNLAVASQLCSRIAVIGGGASGCMAAIAAAQAGSRVTIFEKNEKIGKKIYATGNGRCNLTNLFLDSSCYHTQEKQSSGGETGRKNTALTNALPANS